MGDGEEGASGTLLTWSGAELDSLLVLEVPMTTAGRSRLELRIAKSYDHAVFQVAWNGADVGPKIAGQSPTRSYAAAELGVVDVRRGVNTLSIRIVQTPAPLRESKSPNGVGIDWLRLVPVSEPR